MDIEITDFCKRQYSNSYSGNHLNPDKVKKLIELAQNPYKIVPGYSDFSCLAVIKNKQKENYYKLYNTNYHTDVKVSASVWYTTYRGLGFINGKLKGYNDEVIHEFLEGEKNNKHFCEIGNPVDIEKIHLTVTDEFGRVINLNNMDLSLSLKFVCLYG